MNSLCNNIKILFQDAAPEKIFHSYNNVGNTDFNFKSMSKSLYNNYSFNCYQTNSQDERNQYFNQIKSISNEDLDFSYFNLLALFGKNSLELNNQIPLVRFECISEWRKISHLIGQAIIVTAFLAYNSIVNNVIYDYWAWPTVIKTNNRQLQNILDTGMSENHFHLNGSTQIFPITWVSIMNNPRIISSRIKRIRTNLYPRYSFGKYDNSASWDELLKKAAIIRVTLFEKLRNRKYSVNLFKHSNYISLSDIQIATKRMGYLYGYKTNDGCLDYALTNDLVEDNYEYNRILVGERKFMYDCFKASFSGEFSEDENNQFYYYLLVKNRFRSELIQSNNMTGFSNFSKYQDRKGLFFYGIKKYEVEAVKLSLNDTIKSQSIQSLEARIMPESSPRDLLNSIRFYDNIFNNTTKNDFHENNTSKQKKEHPYFYVLHYPKGVTSCNTVKPYNFSSRNAIQRKKYKYCSINTAITLSNCRSLSNRNYGIDTCSNEIGCRPEVFATDYRYIKNFYLSKLNQFRSFNYNRFLCLGRTYHVGEDFLDLVDGLRAIDEVIRFLDFSQADRLGHALALGLNPYEYYDYKKYKIILPSQDALDNFLWLFYRSAELNITIDPLLKHQIKYYIDDLSMKIYGEFCTNNKIEYSTYDLYCAWKLRGDNPELYKSSEFKTPTLLLNQYEKAMWCENEELNHYRKNNKISKLYYAYHFDKYVRLNGDKPYEFKVENSLINLIAQIQNQLKFEIAHYGIMIECNPSSNCLISTFREYYKHPIITFNNIGLEIDPVNICSCPQISVSINTDDQGVFDTSLEYEYALMASALIELKNEKGNYKYSPEQVYNYLENVRKMGNNQTFSKR